MAKQFENANATTDATNNTNNTNPTCCICGKECENQWGNNPDGLVFTVPEDYRHGFVLVPSMELNLYPNKPRIGNLVKLKDGQPAYAIRFNVNDRCCNECNNSVIWSRIMQAC